MALAIGLVGESLPLWTYDSKENPLLSGFFLACFVCWFTLFLPPLQQSEDFRCCSTLLVLSSTVLS